MVPERQVVPNKELRDRIERRRRQGHEKTSGKLDQAERESEGDKRSVAKDTRGNGKCIDLYMYKCCNSLTYRRKGGNCNPRSYHWQGVSNGLHLRRTSMGAPALSQQGIANGF